MHTEQQKSHNRKPIKTIVVCCLIVLLSFVYYLATGSLPSFDPETRNMDFAKIYFNKKSDLYFKEVDLAGTGVKNYIVFEKSDYFKKVFVSPKDGNVERHVKNAMSSLRQKDGTRLVILKPIDIRILNPIIQLFLPLKKVYDIEYDDSEDYYRVYDVDVSDIDNDGKQELIVHWLFYGGGSGGTFFTTIIGNSNGETKILDFYPSMEPFTKNIVRGEKKNLEYGKLFGYDLKVDDNDEDRKMHKELIEAINSNPRTKKLIEKRGYLLIPNAIDTSLIINGKKINIEIPIYHTDSYYRMISISDKNNILSSFQTFEDGDCHFCTQSWSITTYKFIGKKFVLDESMTPRKVSKQNGWTLPNVHGYTMSPTDGLISYMMFPSWLGMDDTNDARHKFRKDSVAEKYVKDLYK